MDRAHEVADPHRAVVVVVGSRFCLMAVVRDEPAPGDLERCEQSCGDPVSASFDLVHGHGEDRVTHRVEFPGQLDQCLVAASAHPVEDH